MSNTLITIFGFFIIFFMTTLGSAVVFFFKNEIPKKLNALFLGFAAGIMIAASVWSLLIPSMESVSGFGAYKWIPTVIGFIIGGLFLVFLDKVVPHFHSGTNIEEGPHTSLHKSIKLFLAVTIHNIPEGLAVGFAFGAASVAGESAAYISALGLAIGIAIQNFPEGAAVSLPMRGVTGSRNKAFWLGTASGAVEPVAAIFGFALSAGSVALQPWLMAFAAGAMFFVVAEDLIPDANIPGNPHFGTWGVMLGFAVMMILEVMLG